MPSTYTPTENQIETYSGEYLDVGKPESSDIDLESIAHALSNICRYGGHTRTFFSVAEHSVFVSKRVERKGHHKKIQLMALHHDDAEAYLGDIPSPLKPLLGNAYKRLTDKMDWAIAEALNLPITADAFHRPEIKDADNWALRVEARHLLRSGGHNLPHCDYSLSRIVIPDYWIGGLSPERAKELFIRRHYELVD